MDTNFTCNQQATQENRVWNPAMSKQWMPNKPATSKQHKTKRKRKPIPHAISKQCEKNRVWNPVIIKQWMPNKPVTSKQRKTKRKWKLILLAISKRHEKLKFGILQLESNVY